MKRSFSGSGTPARGFRRCQSIFNAPLMRGIVLAGGMAFAAIAGSAQEDQSKQQEVYNGPEVITDVRSDESPTALRDTEPLSPRSGWQGTWFRNRQMRQTTPTGLLPEAVPQATEAPLVATTTVFNFDGLGQGFVGPKGTFVLDSSPPSPSGAVGATQFVEWVNESFAVFNKSTAHVVYGPALGNTLWKGFGGPCETNNDGDSIVQYDVAAGRWVLSQFAVSSGPPYFQCVAVSQTSDATGKYFRYAFKFTSFNGDAKLAVWPDAYYMSFDMLTADGGTFLGPKVCALHRSAMLTGAVAKAQCFQLSTAFESLLPSDLDGAMPPPAGSRNYYFNLGLNVLRLWKFHVDWTTPANSTFKGPISIATKAFMQACGGGTCIPQQGTTQLLDSIGDRLMNRVAYRNFGGHESIVLTHSVHVATGNTGIRWYELRSPGAIPVLFQQGTFSPDSSYRWLGSIGMDKVGNIALGFSVSSNTIHPGIRHTGRVPTDALNTMEKETTIQTGGGAQQNDPSWGEDSSLSIDPTDNCTFWYANEYLTTDGTLNWHTRIAAFKFPTCH